MNKAIVVGLVIAAGLHVARAQPKPPDKPGTGEKNETLNQGGNERPWASGVSDANQQAATKAFQDGNQQLNDGIFTKAAERYREALKSWDHPAIHYNLALALMNLDQPVEVYGELEQSIKYGPTPLEK